jgi:PilZ domain-containing protein
MRGSFLPLLSSLVSFTRLGSLLKSGPKIVPGTRAKKEKSGASDQDRKFEAPTRSVHIHSTERRRTARVALSVPLIIEGETNENEKFSHKTFTQSVSGHGGLAALGVPVAIGQTLFVRIENSEQRAECQIVSIHKGRDGNTLVGFEFAAPESNFWHMTFTVPGAKPLRRIMPFKVSA